MEKMEMVLWLGLTKWVSIRCKRLNKELLGYLPHSGKPEYDNEGAELWKCCADGENENGFVVCEWGRFTPKWRTEWRTSVLLAIFRDARIWLQREWTLPVLAFLAWGAREGMTESVCEGFQGVCSPGPLCPLSLPSPRLTRYLRRCYRFYFLSCRKLVTVWNPQLYSFFFSLIVLYFQLELLPFLSHFSFSFFLIANFRCLQIFIFTLFQLMSVNL